MPKKVKAEQIPAKESKFSKVMNNPNTVFTVLVLLVLLMMWLNLFIIKSHKLYTFGGYNDDISIDNGTLDINYDVNYFRGGNIIYNGKDYTLKSYTIGYYICDGKKNTKLLTTTNQDDEEVSLKNLLQNQELSLTEAHRGAKILTKSKLQKINKLCFIVDGKTDKNKEISIKVKLDTTKLSK